MKLDHVGDISPALLLQLGAQEKALVRADSVRYRDPTVQVNRAKLTFPNPTGMFPFNLWRYFETLEGPGSATVSNGLVGEIRVLTLPSGQSIVLHHAALLAHEASMHFQLVLVGTYQLPNDQNIRYIEGAALTGPGTFALQTLGNALTFQLKPGEWLRTTPHALLSYTPGTSIRISVFGGSPNFPPNHYFPLLDVAGPGTVMVHSGEFVVEGPTE